MGRSSAIGVCLLLVVSGCSGLFGPSGDATSATTATTPSVTTSVDSTAATLADGTTTTSTDATTTDATVTTTTTAVGDGGKNGTLTVHFINVGQSESILAVGPTGETLLVDTGDFRNDGEYVLDYLRARNVTRIDYLVSSHNDADHIGGLAEVITYYETEAGGVGAVYEQGLAAATLTYADYLDAVEAYNVTVFVATTGAAIPLAGVNVSVYAPPEEYLADGLRNENSVVLELGYGETSVLLPGDAEEVEEAYLLGKHRRALDATVLKVPHHGSRTSSSAAFLDAVSPRIVVVASAYDSQYGHPHTEVLERLAARDVPTYWTATHGSVVVTVDGETVEVATQRSAPTDPLALRNASEVEPGTLGDVATRLTIRVDGNATARVNGNATAHVTGNAAANAVQCNTGGRVRGCSS